jgi:hypothetical protein
MIAPFRKLKIVKASELRRAAISKMRQSIANGNADMPRFLFSTAFEYNCRYGVEIMPVNPKSVSFNRWSGARFKNLVGLGKAKLKEVLEASPPILNGYRLRGAASLYAVGSDGNHRIAAAAALGIEEVQCRVTMFGLLQGGIYALGPPIDKKFSRAAEGNIILAEQTGNLTTEQVAKLLAARGADEVWFYG